ncbi:alpha/beta fold hydrolase [Microbacterium invictum]|uniref:Pimeloyl-ACP methyl ester carboxylesterase n=1 Tax=Microbacterium invictum TaxID=515415 RepID=A0AA40VM34_9MICO|nr:MULTISPECIES: alpha/beta fold hydrolase [Microbacterium]MBB4139264.1 pimeloyl-ACP methyl ester carboxylesterase [Microbacterium invictum]
MTVVPPRRIEPVDVRGLEAAQARAVDAALGDVDWRGIPDGVMRTEYAVPSGRLAGLVAGEPAAPRVVLVPGITGSKEDFILMLPLLAVAGMRAETFDMAGQYESHRAGPENLRPRRDSYDEALFVDDLKEVLTVGPVPVHLVGYSFAGSVVSALAARYPEAIASLTLISAPPVIGPVFHRIKIIGPLARAVSPRTAARLMMWGVRRNLNRAPRHRIDFVRERFALTRPDSVADAFELMMRTPDLDEKIAAIAAPKLVVAGAHDLWPEQLHRDYAARIGADLLLTGGGHSPSEDSPTELAHAIVGRAGLGGR